LIKVFPKSANLALYRVARRNPAHALTIRSKNRQHFASKKQIAANRDNINIILLKYSLDCLGNKIRVFTQRDALQTSLLFWGVNRITDVFRFGKYCSQWELIKGRGQKYWGGFLFF